MFLWIRRLNIDKMLILIKIPVGFFFNRNCEIQGTYITQNNLKYSKMGGGLTLPNFITFYKVILIK